MNGARDASEEPIHESIKNLFDVHIGDARQLVNVLQAKSIDVTVTSPPYFDLKDYGVKDQIGYGQTYDQFLEDLRSVFKGVYAATKDQGSLWVVVDTFRKGQEVLPLPFDLAARIRPDGWVLRDIVVWKKDRTLPWTHVGATRKIFEYILVFSKGAGEFRYHPDEFRDSSELKKWWVKYPERYHPKGKSLEEIWSFDIPTQGSWGSTYIRHFCPLPDELVDRIIQLTTRPGDVVLDPFAGSGTVPTVSYSLGRKYIGFELNEQYVQMFREHLARKKEDKVRPILQRRDPEFHSTILRLRMLKFGRLIARATRTLVPKAPFKVLVVEGTNAPTEAGKVCGAEYLIYAENETLLRKIRGKIDDVVAIPPLSKFGVEASFTYRVFPKRTPIAFREKRLFEYTLTNSHKYLATLSFKDAMEAVNVLFSEIALQVEEPSE